jgi:hypothetical protein
LKFGEADATGLRVVMDCHAGIQIPGLFFKRSCITLFDEKRKNYAF